MKKSFKKNERV